MSALESLQLAVLLAFIVINGANAVSLVLAARSLLVRERRQSSLEETVLTRAASFLPVSFIIPAYNEEATLVSSLSSLLALHYPEFEIVVANDGSTDGTLAALQEAFELVPCVPSPRRFAEHKPVRGAWRSASHPTLLIVDKENGGRADALNAALEQARYPLVVATDADSLIDPAALQLAGTRFLDAPTLVGLGGTIRVVNEAKVDGGAVVEARTPVNFIARWQMLEYTRAFIAARTAMSHVGCLLSISGAFGLFRRSALTRVGGFRSDTVGEDLELTIRLHQHYRDSKEPYRIEFMIDPICWTQVPEERKILRSQRDRWHRGLWETIWIHRRMLFNPRYGRIGLLALPYMVFVEGITPVLEVLGYLLIVVLALTGNLEVRFAGAFLALTVLYGMLIGLGAAALDLTLPHSPKRLVDRWRLLNAVLTETLWYRPWLAVVRVVAMFRINSSRGKWGAMTRRRFS